MAGQGGRGTGLPLEPAPVSRRSRILDLGEGRGGVTIAVVSTLLVFGALVLLVTHAPGWPEVKKTFFDWGEFKDSFPEIPDVTASFVYARLQRASEKIETGYAPKALDEWTKRARLWAGGDIPSDLAVIAPPEKSPPKSRDVFIYMINGFKPKAPAAAMALIAKLA